jgi:1-phosphatidylinositol-3-phosphate 5-kinase
VTATHLKRLFANQDVFNSLDRNVAGLSVSEADEKEVKSTTGDSELSTPTTQTPTPDSETTPCLDVPTETCTDQSPSDDGNTPVAGVVNATQDPLDGAKSPQKEEDFDSDSTISAHPKHEPIILSRPEMCETIESSGMESDAHNFVSRLPRRSRPTPR